MKKRLNTETISNELSGASLFFQRPRGSSGEPAPAALPSLNQQEDTHDHRDAKDERPSGAPYARTSVRRRLTRTPFEFYQDQLERLRAMSLAAKLRGEKGSMSEMVRDAVDRYLADRDATTTA